MPSIQTNLAIGKEARERGALTPASPAPAITPIPVAPYPAAPNTYLRTPLPSTYVHTPDTQRQWQNSAVPQQRIPPLSATGNAVTGAQAASQAIQVVQTTPNSGGVSSVALTMPVQYSVSGSPGTGAVNLGVTWLSEASNTVLAGPSGTALDEVDVFSTNTGNVSPVSISAAPVQSGDLAILVTVQDSTSTVLFTPDVSWNTVVTYTTAESIYSKVVSGTSLVSASGAVDPVHPHWCSAMVLLTSKVGFTPSIVHHSTVQSGGFNHGTNLALGFTPTAGNTLLMVFTLPDQAAFLSPASVQSLTDSNGNTWVQLGSVFNSSGNAPQAIVFAASNIAGGATTISFQLNGGPGATAAGDITAIEITNLGVLSQIPTFRPLTGFDIPPISLAKTDVNGGVTGILGRASLPAAIAYTDVGNIFTVGQSISSGSSQPLLIMSNGSFSSQFSQFGQLFLRSDTFPGGLTTPWTNYFAVFGGSSTNPVIGIAPAAGATGDYLDAFLPGSTTVKNFSIPISGKIANYGGIATVDGGIPAEYAKTDTTGSAAITATTLYAVPAGGQGMYRISWSATITTPATTGAATSSLGGTNGFQVLYTSPTDSVVKTTVAQSDWTSTANTTGTAVGGTAIVFAKASTNIQYTFDYASNTANQMIYELHIKLEAL